MSTQGTNPSTRKNSKRGQTTSKQPLAVINSLPFYITKRDILKLFKDYQIKIEKLEDVKTPEMNQLEGKRCIISSSTKKDIESLLQARYLRAETLDSRPLYIEIEPYERKRQPPPMVKRPDEDEFSGISKKVVFVEGLKEILNRKDFIRILKAWKIEEMVEIFIFKVDKDGVATGDIRLLIKEGEDLKSLIEKIPRKFNGQKIKIFYYENADKYFDFKLSKEVEMEKKKFRGS